MRQTLYPERTGVVRLANCLQDAVSWFRPSLRSAVLLLAGLCVVLSVQEAKARCYRVTGTSNNPNNYQVRPEEGVTALIWGADSYEATITPSGINVITFNNSNEFQPNGSLLGSGYADITMEPRAGSPEFVFFRCAPGDADELYEMYTTNGDNEWAGRDEVGASIGEPAVFKTYWNDIGLRYTNTITGQYYTRTWQARKLTDLDVDSRGYLLIKGKNLSGIRTEFFRVEGSRGWSSAERIAIRTEPNAYIAIKGPGITSPTIGADAIAHWPGWPINWPVGWGISAVQRRNTDATCRVTSVTPYVRFPEMSVNELNEGASQQVTFDMDFNCDKGFVEGRRKGGVAFGIVVPHGSALAARQLGLVNAYSASSYLVSDQYGQPGMARGVGIRIKRDHEYINLLTSESVGSGVDNEPTGGWRLPLSPSSVDMGNGNYHETLEAVLEKLPSSTGELVTAGRVRASAQLIFRVQ